LYLYKEKKLPLGALDQFRSGSDFVMLGTVRFRGSRRRVLLLRDWPSVCVAFCVWIDPSVRLWIRIWFVVGVLMFLLILELVCLQVLGEIFGSPSGCFAGSFIGSGFDS